MASAGAAAGKGHHGGDPGTGGHAVPSTNAVVGAQRRWRIRVAFRPLRVRIARLWCPQSRVPLSMQGLGRQRHGVGCTCIDEAESMVEERPLTLFGVRIPPAPAHSMHIDVVLLVAYGGSARLAVIA